MIITAYFIILRYAFILKCAVMMMIERNDMMTSKMVNNDLLNVKMPRRNSIIDENKYFYVSGIGSI